MQIQQKCIRSRGFKEIEISINTISPCEEQINKQAKHHPYVVDISNKQLHFKFHAHPSDLEGFKAKSTSRGQRPKD